MKISTDIKLLISFLIIVFFPSITYSDDQYDPEKILQVPYQNIMNNEKLPGTTGNLGGMSYSIPIKVAPGAGGLVPELTLTYNSNNKRNGWVGVGWDLQLGSIQRSAKTKINFDNFDSFLANNSIELVQRSSWGAGYFGARIENQFVKYRYLGEYSGWEAYLPNGQKHYFGTSSNSRIETAQGVFKWLLDEIVDANDNTIQVTYSNTTDEIYLDEITYSPTGTRIKFERGNRPDAQPLYNCYKKIELRQRLERIRVYGAGGSQAHQYVFQYDVGYNDKSILRSMQEYGSNFSSTSLPATTFSYESGVPLNFNTPQTEYTGITNNFGMTYFADVNGDSLTDMIKLPENSSVYVYLGNSNGDFSNGIMSNTSSTNQSGNIHFGDVNGDGRADMVKYRSTIWAQFMQVYLASTSQDGIFAYYSETQLTTYTGKGQTQLADVNGDNFADLLEFPSSMGTPYIKAHLSDGSSGFTGGTIDTFIGQSNDVGRFFMADVNGDGLSDVIKTNVQNTYVYTYICNGDGTFGTDIGGSTNEPEITILGYFTNPGTLNFSDLNGDGFSDLILTPAASYNVYTFLSDGTGSFLLSGNINTYETTNEPGYIHLADINGDGFSDLIKCQRMGVNVYFYLGDGRGNFTYSGVRTTNNDGYSAILDVNGDGTADILKFKSLNPYVYTYLSQTMPSDNHPDLLVGINNGYGVTSTINYRLSTLYSSIHTPSGEYPNAYLPYATNLVSSIAVNDGIGNVSTTGYNYAGAHYSILEKEFLGLGTVIQSNPNNTTWTAKYHIDDYYLKGRILYSDYDDNSSGDQNLTTYSWESPPIESDIQNGIEKGSIWVRLDLENSSITSGGSAVSAGSNYGYSYSSGYGYVNQITKSGTGASPHIELKTYGDQGNWTWRLTNNTIRQDSLTARQTTFFYDGNGNLETENHINNNGVNAVITRDYDSYGNITLETDPNGNDTTFAYLSGTYLGTKNFEGLTTIYTNHNQWGKPRYVTDEKSQVTEYTYDNYGRVTLEDIPGPGYKNISYSDTTRPRYSVTSLYDGSTSAVDTREYVDGLDRVLQTTQRGVGNEHPTMLYFYDSAGRQWKTAGPFFRSDFSYSSSYPSDAPYKIISSFDFVDRPKVIQTPHDDGTIASTVFSYPGFNRSITDPESKTTIEGRDFLGRIQTIQDANNVVTEYDYNAAGDLTNVYGPLNIDIVLTRNWLGQITAQNDPDLGNWLYTYKPNGEIETITDSKNQVTTFTYDNRNRLETKTFTNTVIPENPVTYVYDLATNGNGKLYSVTKGSVVIINDAYNEVGQLLQKTTVIDGQNHVFYYNYDPAGKIDSILYPDSHFVDYTYHPGTNLISLITALTPDVNVSFPSYSAFGKSKSIEYSPTFTASYDYFTRTGRMDSIDIPGLLEFDYYYTPAGDVSERYDGVRNISYEYEYDDLHRLTNEIATGPFENVSGRTIDLHYEGTAPHAVSRVTTDQGERNLSYGLTGNLTTGYDFSSTGEFPERRINYNAENMPVSIEYESQGNPIVNTAFTYGGNGKRVKKQVETNYVHYIDDTYEIRNSQNVKYIFANNLRLAKIAGDSVEYYHKDHLGSSAVLSDENGDLIKSTDYEPFGNQRKIICNPDNSTFNYGFTDQELDSETGLYNYDARLYDPVLGRFLSADNIIPNWHDPQMLDRYAYVRNNPLRYIDPSGHIPLETILDIASLGESIHSMYRKPSLGNAGFLAWDVAGLIPYVPGSWSGKAVKGAGALLDAKKTGTVGDVTKKLDAPKTPITDSNRLLPLTREPNATGRITSEVLDDSTIFYRAHGGDSGSIGGFLAPSKPLSRAEAIAQSALPPGNTAEYVSTLRVQGGARVQRSTASAAFGQPGGAQQVQLLERAKIQILKTEPLQ